MALTYGFCLDGADSVYTSEQFSQAFQAVFGDGVCQFGQQFALTAVENFTVTIGTGFALTAGRWLENDEPLPLTLPTAGNYADRYDAVTVRADYGERKVFLEIMEDVDPALPPRNGKEYALFLYLIRVRRGATVLTDADITDTRSDPALCGYIRPLSEVSGVVERVYTFLRSGIDAEIDRILALGDTVVEGAEDAIIQLDKQIGAASGTAVGDTTVSLTHPLPAAEWLPCDGSPVPADYPTLSALIGGTLPLMEAADPRWGYWIYGGKPV